MEFDSKTFASNPGDCEIEWGVYWSSFPERLFVGIMCVLIGGGIGVGMYLYDPKTPWWLAVVMGAALAMWIIAQHAQTMATWMKVGDTNPAIVLDPADGLIAVWADMSSRPPGVVPAIKVRRVPLPRGLSPGERLTTVCIYFGPDGRANWEDVTPVPIRSCTLSADTIARSLARVPDQQWQLLDLGLSELGDKAYQPGIYFLDSQRGTR
jgi:hypothetical protein